MCAPLLCTSKACPLLIHLPWSKGSSVHYATYPWPLIAWTIFWFPILYSLLLLGAGLYLIVGFSSFSILFCSFCSLATIVGYDSCCTILSFLLWCYLTRACWAFFSGFILMLLWTFLSHYIACGLFCPIFSSLGILGPFAFLGHLPIF